METIVAPSGRSLPPVPRAAATAPVDAPDDLSQVFVTRVRSAAADFAAAAGAESAVVCEVVPPARHRRSRCRLVLQYADGGERDLTFLGAAGNPTRSRLSFDRHVQGWLGAGQLRDPGWLVVDADAADGVAIDVPAWLAVAATTR